MKPVYLKYHRDISVIITRRNANHINVAYMLIKHIYSQRYPPVN